MMIATTPAELEHTRIALCAGGRRLAFVPTMGNLHAGHLRLIEEARRRAEVVVVSIYVNPLQFGPGEDFAAYPRTIEADRRALEGLGVELLFAPSDSAMYPRGPEQMTRVEVPGLGDILCGAYRPGHFRGVTTVVNRLLNLVRPEVAVFGNKDYQQLLLVRLMVADLGMPVEIVGIDTVREPDGLALSSRNRYLGASERALAPRLNGILRELCERMAAAPAARTRHEAAAIEALAAAGFRPDYVSVRRRDLAEPQSGDRELVALAAAWLGRTRLIDNLEFSVP